MVAVALLAALVDRRWRPIAAEQLLELRLQPPGGGHLLGLDELGATCCRGCSTAPASRWRSASVPW